MKIYKTKPWEHQRREVEGSWMDPERLLVWWPRTGKSKAIIDSISLQVQAGGFDRVIIIAPNTVHENWVLNEFPTHSILPFAGFVWDSKKAATLRTAREWEQFMGYKGLKVFAINKEAVLSGHSAKFLRQFACTEPCGIVIDEAHHFGTREARMSARVKGLAYKCVWKRALTGTPIDNTPLKFYSICNLLHLGALGYTKFSEFKDRYAVFADMWGKRGFYKRPVSYKNIPELIEKVREFSSLVRREECPDLPSLLEETRVFRMTDKQQARYDEISALVRAEVIDFRAAAPRMLAVTSNFEYPDEDNPRVNALLEVLFETPEKCIIWCQYKEEIRKLSHILRGCAVAYYGDIKRSDRLWAMQQFRDNLEVRYFIGQPQCAGEGLNISSAQVVVWFSNTFDLRVYNQAVERATQMGKKTVSVIRLLAKGTVDESIFRAHAFKRNVLEFCFEEWEEQNAKSKDPREKFGCLVPAAC